MLCEVQWQGELSLLYVGYWHSQQWACCTQRRGLSLWPAPINLTLKGFHVLQNVTESEDNGKKPYSCWGFFTG